MTRQRVSLQAPSDDPTQLEGFPRSTLDPDTPLWRVVREGHGPWWFSSSMAGRFDLADPDGTCYLAADELTAVLEVFGPDRSGGKITTEALRPKRLFRLRLPESRSLADLTSRRAAGFGVTHEVHSHPRYDLTQAWALRLHGAGADGLRYLARHDPAPGTCLALFGPSGDRDDWPRGEGLRLDQPELIERLWRECRIRVVERPRLDQLPVRD